MKYKPKIISNIHLTCLDYSNTGKLDLRTLCKSLKDAKNMSSLIIDTKTPNTKQLPHLLNVTNRWKKLKFHYNQNERKLNKETIKNLTRLRRCPDLSALDISVDYKQRSDVVKEMMSSLSQQLRGLSHFKTFKASSLYQWGSPINDVDYYTPFFCFRYPISLKSLTLHLTDESFLQQGQDIFLSNIQQLNSLEHLDISFNLFSTSLDLRFWDKFFERIQRIKSLRFFHTNSRLSEETTVFLQGFSQLRNLTSFELILKNSQSENQTYMFTDLLCQHLACLQNLKSLSFAIHMEYDSKREFVDLLPSIKNLTRLERLQLKLYRSDCINWFLQSLQHLPHLTSLDIQIQRESGISYSTIYFLADSLQELKNLQTLNICFPNLDQNYASVETLSMSITQLNLKSLSLTLGEESHLSKPPKKVNTKKLTSLFSRSNLLSNLSLHLSTFALSVKECKRLSLALKELQQLKSLSLVLPKFDSIDQFGSLQSILLSIKTMPKLTSLSLQCGIQELHHKEVHDLASDLGDCAALESLNLSLGVRFGFPREIFRSLLFGIADLSPLRNLQLSLGGIYTHVQAPPDDVFQELKDLKNLETIDFVVSWTDTVSMNGDLLQGSLGVFRKKLEKYSNFKRLTKLSIVENIHVPCF